MIRDWIILLACLLCVFCAASAFKYGTHRELPKTRPYGATLPPPLQRSIVDRGPTGIRNRPTPVNGDRTPDDMSLRVSSNEDATHVHPPARINPPQLQELPLGMRELMMIPADPEAVAQETDGRVDDSSVAPSAPANAPETGLDATATSGSRSFPALARKTRVPQSSISSQYLSSFHVSAPSSDHVDYVSERFAKTDAESESHVFEVPSLDAQPSLQTPSSPSRDGRLRGHRASSRPEEWDVASSPVDVQLDRPYQSARRLAPSDAAGTDAVYEVDSRKTDRMTPLYDEPSGHQTTREVDRRDALDKVATSPLGQSSSDESVGNRRAYERDNTTGSRARHPVVASTAISSPADESVGNHRVYERDNTAGARAHSVQVPVLFIRSELKERALRLFSTENDAFETANQTDDDYMHVAMDRDDHQQPFRFNGVVFNWTPSECKQNQPIFFLSGGIHVTHVGSTLLLKHAEDVHEIAIDRSYQTYLVCIWSYDSIYHMSVLGQHRTTGWDSAWYGTTVREQPHWNPSGRTALHIHRSIHGLVWYQSNAVESSIPDERYMQSIAVKRFQ